MKPPYFTPENKKHLLMNGLLIAFGVCLYFYFIHIEEMHDFWAKLTTILSPFIIGGVFAYLLFRPTMWAEKMIFALPGMKKAPARLVRLLAIVLAVTFFVVLIVILIANVLPELVNSLMTLFNAFPELLASMEENIWTWLDSLNESQQEYLQSFIHSASTYLQQMAAYLATLIPEIFNYSRAASKMLLNIFVSMIITVYLLLDKEAFLPRLKRNILAIFGPQKAARINKVGTLTNHIFSNFIAGKILDSIIIGVLCFACLALMKMPYHLLISVIIGVTNVIPFFGPFIGAVPSIFLILMVDPPKALLLAIFILILQQVDGNIIGPKILGDSTGLPSIWIVFAILVGGGLFGFIGMLVGVPTFAVIYTLFNEFAEKKIAEQNNSGETNTEK